MAFFRTKRTGTLVVSSTGDTSFFIETGWTPKSVDLKFTEHKGHIPVCNADLDFFDVKIAPHGFWIFVKISSSQREIEWIAYR